MKKQLISMLLAVCMITTLLPTMGNDVFAAGGLTRAEWITQLVAAFEMTVEDDSNMPDNYFSDISEDDSYYRDILLAVEFGVIDLEAGEAFEPNEPATREFAAQTLNSCLQYQLDEDAEYTFSESETVTYPDDIQVAINRGWFTLSGGNFLPEQGVTSAEAEAMLADAKAVIAGDVVDENYNSQYEFADGVIVVPETADVTIEGEYIVTIADWDGTISENDIFVVYSYGIPVPLKAETVETGETTIITATKEGTDDAIVSADSQGITDVDLENFQMNEVQTFSVIDTSNPYAEYEELQIRLMGISYDQKSKKLVASKNISLGGSFAGSVNIELTNMKLKHKSKTEAGDYEVSLVTNTKVTTSLSFDLGDYAGIPSSLILGYIPIEGVGNIKLEMEYNIKGGISMTWTGNLEVGVAYSRSSGFRTVQSFKKKDFSFTAYFELRAGIKISANFEMLVFKASAWATIGVKMYQELHSYDNGTPHTCVTISGFMYANMGVSATVNSMFDKKEFKKQIDIYTESNSPVRVVYHYEDNVLVSSCKRGNEIKYHTYPRSKYFNPYTTSSSYGGSGSGFGETAEPIVIWEYEVDDGNATITGYNGTASAVAIPSELDGYKVTKIAEYAFRGNNLIRSITMPDTIMEIEGSAFQQCKNLQGVKLPEYILSLSDHLFYQCESLSSVIIPENVTSIDGYAFKGCISLTEIDLPKNLEELGTEVFGNCTALGRVFIPKSLTTTSFYPFKDCISLKNIDFEYGVLNIADHLFQKCTGIEEITIPDTVTKIGYDSFDECINLKKVNFPSSVLEIGNYAFRKCEKLENVVLPEYLTTIGTSAFRQCTAFTKLDLPDSVISIDDTAFENCSGLSNVKLSKNLESLGYDVFKDCKLINNIVIPKTIQHCSFRPFNGCSGLKNVTFESGITLIPTFLFESCDGLEEITIPDTVTEIGWAAFGDCPNLKKVTLSNQFKTAGWNIFENCTSLTEIKLPDSLTETGMGMFKNCTALKKITMPANLEKIENGTFSGCTALEEMTIPDTCTEIDSMAFMNCKKLQEINIPNGMKKIYGQAFSECDKLTKIVIPDSVEELDYKAFYGCDLLSDVTLGNGIKEIEREIFRQCPALESITIPRFCTTIAANAFAEDVKLTTAYIPPSVTKIENNSFSYPAKMTVYGKSGSYAEKYASSRNIKFNAVDTPITTIKYTDNKMSIGRNETVMPQLNIEPKFDTDTVTFSSSDENILTVLDTGSVTSSWRNYGTAKITATTGSGKSTSIDITVIKTASSLSLNASSLNLDLGAEEKLTVTMNPSDAVDVLEWSSSNSDIAEVHQDGNVTAKAKGTAVITVKASYSGVSATCTVTVIPPAEITAFTVDNGENGYTTNITTADIPTGAAVWVAAYDTDNRLVGIQKVAANKAVQAEFDTPDAANFKAFVWNMATLKPLTNSKEAPVTTGV